MRSTVPALAVLAVLTSCQCGEPPAQGRRDASAPSRPDAEEEIIIIGGDAGVRHFGAADVEELAPGLPFMALAPSMIPAEVLEVIGPAPESEPTPPLLLT